MDTQAEFDSLIVGLRNASALAERDVFAMDKIVLAAQQISSERGAILARCAPGVAEKLDSQAALLMADIVAVAAGHAVRNVEKFSDERRQASGALVDLWGRAEACRALWFETYVQWPTDRVVERRRALAETVMQIASESIGMALRFSGACQQFVDFVTKVSSDVERLKATNP